jgi:hypothetical protein
MVIGITFELVIHTLSEDEIDFTQRKGTKRKDSYPACSGITPLTEPWISLQCPLKHYANQGVRLEQVPLALLTTAYARNDERRDYGHRGFSRAAQDTQAN